MNPGEFRHKIDIGIITEGQGSDYGNVGITNTTTLSRFAKVKWLSSSEVIQAETLTMRRNIEVTFRYDGLMDFIDRMTTITYDNGIYKIDRMRITGLGNNQYIVMQASTFLN
jgi:SPP1 family predicted phage head-tail adaptor|tara:strand:+ start:822 stop:1157 length:336 start_codon:yes stop_codon:yes gene_type:complete